MNGKRVQFGSIPRTLDLERQRFAVTLRSEIAHTREGIDICHGEMAKVRTDGAVS